MHRVGSPVLVRTMLCFAFVGSMLALVLFAATAIQPEETAAAESFTACYHRSNRAVRLVDDASQCSRTETAFRLDDTRRQHWLCWDAVDGRMEYAGSGDPADPRWCRQATAADFVRVPSETSAIELCVTTATGALTFPPCGPDQNTIIVPPRNKKPVADDIAASVLEDGAATITLSATDDDGEPVTFAIVQEPTNGSLGAPTGTTCSGGVPNSCSATVQYVADGDFFGSDSFTYRANDGIADSASATVSIAVIGVNDAPVFAPGSDVTVSEDSGPYSDSWASAIDAGPGENAQTITFVVTGNTNPVLFASGPAVSSSGTLSFAPAADANGIASVTVQVTDDGGTDNGGSDAGNSATLLITVRAVNDPPSFTIAGNQTVDEDAVPQAVANFATNFDAGPPDEDATQSLVRYPIANDNEALFTTGGQPDLLNDGTLTFTTAPNASGVATVRVRAMDDGGEDFGGSDTSPAQEFTITVNAVNDAPVNTVPGAQTTDEDTPIVFSTANGNAISIADTDAGTVPVMVTLSVASGTLTLSTTAGLSFSDGDGTADLSMTASGTIPDINASLEGLTYAPNANVNGTDTLTVATDDQGATGSGGTLTDTDAVSITITAVNDPPVLTVPGSVSVTEDVALVLSGISIADVDAGGLSNIQLVLSVPAGQGFFTGGTASSIGVSGSGTSMLTIDATLGSINNYIALGMVTFTPATDSFDDVQMTVTANDLGRSGADPGLSGGPSDEQDTETVLLDLISVNDAPTFTSGGDVSISPGTTDFSAQWAADVSPGPANESGQTVQFQITGNSNPGLFTPTGQPVISTAGVLSFTAIENADGLATITVVLQDDGGTANGGVDSSAPVSFTIATNRPPTVSDIGPQTVLEDGSTGPLNVTVDDPDEGPDGLTLTVTSDNDTLLPPATAFTVGGSGANRTISITPAADQNGTATVTVTVTDSGSLSATDPFVLTVTAVNDPPTFLAAVPPAVNEDSPAQTIPNWATGFNPGGGPDEAAQTLIDYTVSVTSGVSLFAVAPAVAIDGTLTYTLAADQHGVATFEVTATDSGSGTPPNDNTGTQSYSLTVNAVNDAPVNTVPAAQTVNEDSDLVFSAGNGNALSVSDVDAGSNLVQVTLTAANGIVSLGNAGVVAITGGANSSSTVTFTGTIVNVNTALGGLTFRGTEHFNSTRGAASLVIQTNDLGQSGADPGTSGGTGDEQDSDTIGITVNAVNDLPLASARDYGTDSVETNMQRAIDQAAGLLVGATDPDTGDAGYIADFAVGTVNGVAPVSGTITAVIANVGIVVADADSGSFTFEPAAGVTGTVSFPFTVCDSGNPAPSQCSAAVNATFNISGPVTWFVNPNAATNGTGTLASPFNTLAAAIAVDQANHRIFVYSGSTSAATSIALNTGQWLVGQQVTGFASFDLLMGISVPAGTIARPAIGTGTATLQNTVTLNTDVQIKGIKIASTASTAMNDPAAAISNVSVVQTTVETTTGTALLLSDISSGTLTFSSLTAGMSSTSPSSGVNLTTIGADVTISTGSIARTTSVGILINGGGGDFNYGGSIGNITAGGAVEIANRSSSADHVFTGAISVTGGTGILISQAVGTVEFSGAITLSTGANAAFTATSSGTIQATDTTSTLTTTTGTALNVANTTIHANGLKFRSISSNGAATGITLSNTGSFGSLTVSGNGGTCTLASQATCSGGRILASTGVGVVLNNTSNPSLSFMNIANGGAEGITASSMSNGLTLANVVLASNGNLTGYNTAGEGHLEMVQVGGTVSITSSVLDNGYAGGIVVDNSGSTALTLNITSSFLTNSNGDASATSSCSAGCKGVNMELRGATSTTLSVTGSTLSGNSGDHFDIRAKQTANLNVTISGNTMRGEVNPNKSVLGAGILIAGLGDATLGATFEGSINYTVANNDIEGNVGGGAIAINLSPLYVTGGGTTFVQGGGDAIGTISGNRIGEPETANSGSEQGSGISLQSRGGTGSVHTVSVTNNAIFQYNNHGIDITIGETNSDSQFNATITGNTINSPGTFGANGIHLNSGPVSSSADDVCVGISSNTLAGSGANGSTDVRLRQRQQTTVRLPGYVGTPGDVNAVVAFIQSNNPGSTGSAVAEFNNTPSEGGGFVGGATCATP